MGMEALSGGLGTRSNLHEMFAQVSDQQILFCLDAGTMLPSLFSIHYSLRIEFCKAEKQNQRELLKLVAQVPKVCVQSIENLESAQLFTSSKVCCNSYCKPLPISLISVGL